MLGVHARGHTSHEARGLRAGKESSSPFLGGEQLQRRDLEFHATSLRPIRNGIARRRQPAAPDQSTPCGRRRDTPPPALLRWRPLTEWPCMSTVHKSRCMRVSSKARVRLPLPERRATPARQHRVSSPSPPSIYSATELLSSSRLYSLEPQPRFRQIQTLSPTYVRHSQEYTPRTDSFPHCRLPRSSIHRRGGTLGQSLGFVLRCSQELSNEIMVLHV